MIQFMTPDNDALVKKYIKRKVEISFWGEISVDPNTIRITREAAEISLDRLEALVKSKTRRNKPEGSKP